MVGLRSFCEVLGGHLGPALWLVLNLDAVEPNNSG
jgi:hypothetical protein